LGAGHGGSRRFSDQAIKVDLTGVAQLSLTLADEFFPKLFFVEEGFPISGRVSGVFGRAAEPAMVRKLALIAPLTNETGKLFGTPAASGRDLEFAEGTSGRQWRVAKVFLLRRRPGGPPPRLAGLFERHSADCRCRRFAKADDIKRADQRDPRPQASTRASIFFVGRSDGQASTLSMQPWPNFKRTVIEGQHGLAPGVIVAIRRLNGISFAGGEGAPVVDVSKKRDACTLLIPAIGACCRRVALSPRLRKACSQTDKFLVCALCLQADVGPLHPASVAWIENAAMGDVMERWKPEQSSMRARETLGAHIAGRRGSSAACMRDGRGCCQEHSVNMPERKPPNRRPSRRSGQGMIADATGPNGARDTEGRIAAAARRAEAALSGRGDRFRDGRAYPRDGNAVLKEVVEQTARRDRQGLSRNRREAQRIFLFRQGRQQARTPSWPRADPGRAVDYPVDEKIMGTDPPRGNRARWLGRAGRRAGFRDRRPWVWSATDDKPGPLALRIIGEARTIIDSTRGQADQPCPAVRGE